MTVSGSAAALRPCARHGGGDQAEHLAQGEDDGQSAHAEAPERRTRAVWLPLPACFISASSFPCLGAGGVPAASVI